MKIGIASDHRGYKLKEYLKLELSKINHDITDFGTNNEESTDYPNYAFPLSEAVISKNLDMGIAICGSGIGISIACNKVKGIRCARVTTIEDAIVTRNDNDSNIIALSGDLPEELAIKIVNTFIETPHSSEEKHHRRVAKIKKYEEEH